MKTIIVPVDFSPTSNAACKYAIDLARDVKAKVIIMHAFESTVLYSKMPLVTVQLDYSYLYNAAVNKLKTYYNKISKSAGRVEVELNIQQGLPSARTSELAIEKKADLIVVGTTGKGAVERVMLGSNTSRIINNAPCMILAVPLKATYDGLKKIIYATDLSKENLIHAQQLIPLANKFDSELIFLNIGKEARDLSNDELKKFKSKIKSIVHYSKMSGFVAKDDNISRGIDYFLKYHKADCLAVYTHHRNIFTGLFNKSIAKTLSIHTSIPMLIIHKDDYLDAGVV